MDYWPDIFRRIKENDPFVTELQGCGGGGGYIQNMTEENWEELGRDIANNTHLTKVELWGDALNDHKMSLLFRGLTGSSSIEELLLYEKSASAAAVRSIVPFLQNANNLALLIPDDNNLRSEGFDLLFRALQNSPIEELYCDGCGIESIEIDSEHIPRNLNELHLSRNNIIADGCRGLAKLLQGGDATLTSLFLQDNLIDDEGVAILADALQNNKSLKTLLLSENDGISKQGKIMLLKLVNDVSSIEATLQSNHTLTSFLLEFFLGELEIKRHVEMAIQINCSPETAGREKMIQTQLNSERRAELAELQRVTPSVLSEIDPLHLPEVLSLVGQHHGQGELYVALKSSIAGVISTVNRKQFLKQKRVDLKARLEAIEAEIATIDGEIVTIDGESVTIDAEIVTMEAADARAADIESEVRNNKRRRK